MFGQASSSSPFGSPAPAPFGTPAPTFGTPAGAFGSTPAAPSAPSFGFGSPAQPAFGSTTTAAPATGATGAFGGSSGAFGTPAAPAFGSAGTTTTTPFGAPAPAPGGLFGAPAAPAGGLFGAPAPAPGGLFGAPTAPAPAGGLFGAPAAAPAFGAPAAPAAPSFGFGGAAAPAPASGGLFGAPAPAPGGLFGGSTAAAPTAFGGFGVGGGMNQQQQRPGTLSQPWSATNRSDGSSNMSLQAITAMTAYEGKSFEELRLEDYTAGNKGSQGQQQPATGGGFGGGGFGGGGTSGGFGSTGTTGGLFGAPAPAPAAFGAPASTPAFGAPAFGAPAPAAAAPAFGGSTFGAPAPAPSTGFGFGAAANKPATGLFGSAPAPAPGGLFGAPAPAPAGGLFGAAPAAPSTSPFGAPAPAPSTGLFGAPAPAASTGLFGKPAAAAPSTGLFGAPAPAPTTGLFGAPAAAAPTSLFGAPAPAPAGGFFGAPAPSTSLFGAPAPAPSTGLFGAAAPAPTTGLFGAPAPAPSLFGAPAPAAPSAGLFGQSPPLAVAQPNADTLLAQQLAAIENQKKELALLEPWRSVNKEDTTVVPVSSNDSTLRSYAASGIKNMPKASIRIKPRGGSPKVSLSDTKLSPLLSPEAFLSGGAKRLVIQPSSLRPPPKMKLLMNGNGEEKEEEKQGVNKTLLFQSSPAGEWHSCRAETPNRTDLTMTSPNVSVSTPKADTTPTAPTDYSYELYKQVTNSTNSDSKTDGLLPDKNALIPSLTKQGYQLQPPLSSLQSMTEVQLATVPNFTISRTGYGSVTWEGKVDIRNVDLDKIVSIEEREVFVYDEEEMNGTKPPIGEQLNRPAVITLEKVFPKATSSKEKFEAKIVKITKKMGAEFIDYNGNNGIWKFKVNHFSRYGFHDDSDDDDEEEEEEVVTSAKKATPVIMEDDNLALVPGDGVDDPDENTPPIVNYDNNNNSTKGFHMIAPTDDDSQSEDESSHDENTQDTTTDAFQKAEDAYRAMMMQSAMNPMYDNGGVVMRDVTPVSPRGEESYDDEEEVEEKSDDDDDEEEVESDYTIPTPIPPSVTDCRISSHHGFCAIIAQRCGVTDKSSAVDYGMRLGRSFRSGVTPVGSIVVRCDDVIREHQWEMTSHNDTNTLTSVLKVHLANAVATPTLEEDGIPLFSLPTGLGANGTQASYSQLCIALDQYISITKDMTKIPHQAFRLLSLLYGQNEKTNTLLSSESPRRSAALRVFFRDLNGSVVRSDVNQALNQKNPPEAILAAVIGGDYKLACRLAMTHGYDRLATLLACPVVSAGDVRRQREEWEQTRTAETMPEALRRVYALLGGERDLEENTDKKIDWTRRDLEENTDKKLDWTRRLQIILETQPSENIKNHIYQYESDVQSNIAPPPLPHYDNVSENATCLLWRILKLRATNGGRSFREGGSIIDVVSPEGYTADDHDLSWAFHLAALLHALGCAPQMTDVEHDRLIDGFSAQLINKGLWEWAVYVTLNTTTTGTTTNAKQKIQKAKSIIHRHFTPDCIGKRSFLEEQIKIPPSIFDMALADRHAYHGQAMPYVTQLIKANSPAAITATEHLIIPNSVIQGSTHLTSFLMTMKENLQEAPEWNRVNGCGAILDLLQLSTEVYDFCCLSFNERQEMIKLGRVDECLSLVRALQSRIMMSQQSDEKSKTTSRTVVHSDEIHYIDFLPFEENNNIHDIKNVYFKEVVAALTKLYMRLLSYKIDDRKQFVMNDSLSQLSLSTMRDDGLSYHDVPEDENKKHNRAGNMHYFMAL